MTKQQTDSIPVNARYPAALIRALDDWRREQPDLPTRAVAIRRILAEHLQGKTNER
jgi:hypothetical protein